MIIYTQQQTLKHQNDKNMYLPIQISNNQHLRRGSNNGSFYFGLSSRNRWQLIHHNKYKQTL
jgi:hypothetical protein